MKYLYYEITKFLPEKNNQSSPTCFYVSGRRHKMAIPGSTLRILKIIHIWKMSEKTTFSLIDQKKSNKIFPNSTAGHGRLPENDRIARIHQDRPVTKNILFNV